jgi:hypothetical protein
VGGVDVDVYFLSPDQLMIMGRREVVIRRTVVGVKIERGL